MEDWLSETLKCVVEMICQTPTRDESEFQNFMEQLRRDLFPQGREPLPNGVHEQNLNEMQLIKKVWGHIQDNAWGYISGASGGTLVRAVISSVLDEVVLAFEGTIRPYNIASGVRCTAIVGGLYLCGTIGYNVYQAARGRRSWKRVGKNVMEEVAAVSAGAVAGICIAALLAPFCGISLICGGLIGIAANVGARTLAKKYTGRLFNIPEDEMLEKAYATLDQNQLVANNEISKAYRQKSREFHPDKINSKYPNATEDEKNQYIWRHLKVQAAFGMIMAARNNDIVDYENARKNFEKIVENELLQKNEIDICLKMWMIKLAQKWWPLFMQTKTTVKYPAIKNGFLPYEVFVDVDYDVEEAVAG